MLIGLVGIMHEQSGHNLLVVEINQSQTPRCREIPQTHRHLHLLIGQQIAVQLFLGGHKLPLAL